MLTDRYPGGSQTPYTVRLGWRPRPCRTCLAAPFSPLQSSRPRSLAALVTAAFAGSAVRAAPAQAATPCWKLLLNDWYDGRIDQTYAVHCYKDALKHLPSDVQTYSSAHDDILRALQSAITKQKSEHKNVSNNTLVPPEQSGSGRAGLGGSGGAARAAAAPTTTTSTSTHARRRASRAGTATAASPARSARTTRPRSRRRC